MVCHPADASCECRGQRRFYSNSICKVAERELVMFAEAFVVFRIVRTTSMDRKKEIDWLFPPPTYLPTAHS